MEDDGAGRRWPAPRRRQLGGGGPAAHGARSCCQLVPVEEPRATLAPTAGPLHTVSCDTVLSKELWDQGPA
jgi:hypothetical protein